MLMKDVQSGIDARLLFHDSFRCGYYARRAGTKGNVE